MKEITLENIQNLKESYRGNYSVPKWITFSEILLYGGWCVRLHRSRSTVSKYLYISKEDKEYKVRFSNHKAAFNKEASGDCDFYVGVGNNGVIRTEQLVAKLLVGTEDELK